MRSDVGVLTYDVNGKQLDIFLYRSKTFLFKELLPLTTIRSLRSVCLRLGLTLKKVGRTQRIWIFFYVCYLFENRRITHSVKVPTQQKLRYNLSKAFFISQNLNQYWWWANEDLVVKIEWGKEGPRPAERLQKIFTEILIFGMENGLIIIKSMTAETLQIVYNGGRAAINSIRISHCRPQEYIFSVTK